eukprot:3936748-Rhodomonas_salina.3
MVENCSKPTPLLPSMSRTWSAASMSSSDSTGAPSSTKAATSFSRGTLPVAVSLCWSKTRSTASDDCRRKKASISGCRLCSPILPSIWQSFFAIGSLDIVGDCDCAMAPRAARKTSLNEMLPSLAT